MADGRGAETATETRRTVCNRDCPDACALVATVEDGRLVRLEGDPEHPVTKGFLCSRTSRFPARQNSPRRLTSPLLRTPNGFEAISWDEAIGHAADRLLAIRAESGPAAVLHYRSGGSLGLVKTVVDLFWQSFGPVTVKRGDICSGAGDAAQATDFGEEESNDLHDLRNSRNILLWGKNPAVSSVHLLPILKEARRRGARVILVDPIRQRSSSVADRVILPRPGADFSLAMAVAARLFETGREAPDAGAFCDHLDSFRALALSKGAAGAGWAAEADVTASEVDALADALADGPCSIQIGWGMARRTNGSAIVRAIDALAAVSGNLGIPGGGASYYYARRRAFDTSFLSKAPPRTLSEPLLGEQILSAKDPAVRAVWVTAANPVAMLPASATVARALETREFVVVVDSFLTDTARRAHLVLPTTTLVEEEDLLGAYGHHWLGSARPVLAPPPGVLSDLEIVQRLAAAIDSRGLPAPPLGRVVSGSARDWKRRLLAKVAPLGATLEAIEAGPVRNPLAPKVVFEGRKFSTPSGRVNLVHTVPDPPPTEPGFPLWLFSNSTERAQCSQWDGDAPALLPATCHPDATRGQGLSDGDEAYLESPAGRLRVRVVHDGAQRTDVVLVPKGGHYDDGTCANTLVTARSTDAGEGAAYLDCRVRFAPIG